MGFKAVLIQNLVVVTLLLSIVFGVAIGMTMILIHPDKYTYREIMYVGFPGQVFMRMVRAVVIPLVASCIIFSLGNVYIQLLKRFGYQYTIYIIVTKLETAILAACIGMLFRPGKSLEKSVGSIKHANPGGLVTITDIFMDALRNLCPVNLVEVWLRHYKTRLVNTNNDTIDDIDKWEVLAGDRRIDYINVLGLLSICVVSGITLNLIEEEGKYVLSLVKCVIKAIMVIKMWVMRLAPIGSAFIIAEEILQIEGGINLLTKMSSFIAALFTACAIQIGIVYSLTYFVFVRKNPLQFFWNYSEPMMITLTTGKSYPGLAYALNSLRMKCHMDSRVVDFVMPMGMYLNKDANVIWLVLGVIFITELNNMPMGLGELCTIMVFSALGSMDTTGVPYATINILNAILVSRGIPSTEMHLLLAIDWICTRVRAVTNICAFSVGVIVLNQTNRRLLEEFPETDTPPEVEKA